MWIGLTWTFHAWNSTSLRMLQSLAGWQQDFVKFMRFSQNSNVHYYFLLDWPAALVGPSEFALDYHLMQAYRNDGYYPKQHSG